MSSRTDWGTPEHCIADFCLVPIGTNSPSVSAEIATIQHILEKSGLKYELRSAGTTLEGPWDAVMNVVGQAHAFLHTAGIVRIQTDIRVGTRTDKKQSFSDKVPAVERVLSGES